MVITGGGGGEVERWKITRSDLRQGHGNSVEKVEKRQMISKKGRRSRIDYERWNCSGWAIRHSGSGTTFNDRTSGYGYSRRGWSTLAHTSSLRSSWLS